MGIAPKIGGGGADTSLDEILMTGLGLVSRNIHPNQTSGSTAPTAGTIYVTAVPYRSGQAVTNTCWALGTAGSGTVPTHIFTGIADSTGKMLAQSADDAANAGWKQVAVLVQSPLSAKYTIPSDGLYYNVLLQVGSWSVTQMAVAKLVNSNLAGGLAGTQQIFGTAGTAQSALPANASSLTIVTTSGISYWGGAS